jgi:hypothetical protein
MARGAPPSTSGLTGIMSPGQGRRSSPRQDRITRSRPYRFDQRAVDGSLPAEAARSPLWPRSSCLWRARWPPRADLPPSRGAGPLAKHGGHLRSPGVDPPRDQAARIEPDSPGLASAVPAARRGRSSTGFQRSDWPHYIACLIGALPKGEGSVAWIAYIWVSIGTTVFFSAAPYPTTPP